MAQLILSQAGGLVGQRLLPNGVSFLGQQLSGQALGQYVGSLAGSAVDSYLFAPRLEGPRISELHLTQSNEGAVIPNVYGRMRLGCNVIWAARFKERVEKSGKGGPNVTTYDYSMSFAVGLCEGEILRVTRAWANGAPLNLSKVNWRLYHGTEDQAPDPLIEAIEGTGKAPAYKGLAYIVFEDLPLDEFGARIPQLSFEVLRPVGDENRLENSLKGLNLIPGSGEFAYATQIIRRTVRFGEETAENAHNDLGVADFSASLEQLVEDFPNLMHVNLIVGWFGDSTDCASCEIRPGVERIDRKTRPRSWRVAGQSRETAHLISQNAEGRPNYGGTPDDESVIEAIRALKARGLKVTLYPFLFMDSPGFPWRGRVTCAPEIEMSSAAANAVSQFFGNGSDWRYRRFILHYAELAEAAGGVDAFLIGSEMIGLTHIRASRHTYPATSLLKTLAADVRAILRLGTEISYAADWTEYGAYTPQDGSNDVDFPLDDLWADDNIDFIGLDWYPPLGDWRDGDDHLDAQAGYKGPDESAYLSSQIEGGEGYDWYYADQAAREAQSRTPIHDSAYGDHWIFRQKDIRNWWANTHYPRPGGSRSDVPTNWVPQSKPVRFTEFGCPAVDKGANQPNVFFDPKSDESALPHFSNGSRDDVIQRRSIETFLNYWSDDPMLDADGIALWAYDMRPFPVFPLREDIWSDGANWRLGHWLNGRVGIALLSDIVEDLAARADIVANVSGLNGLVSGYALDGVMSVRDALEPLRTAFDFRCVERPEGLTFTNQASVSSLLSPSDMAMPQAGGPVELSLASIEKPDEEQVRLRFIDSEADGQPGAVLSQNASAGFARDISLALVMDRDQAQRLVDELQIRSQTFKTSGSLNLSPAMLGIEPGDVVSIDGSDLEIISILDSSVRQIQCVRPERLTLQRQSSKPAEPILQSIPSLPEIIVAEGPPLPGQEEDARPFVFAAALPWPGSLTLEAGGSPSQLTPRCEITSPCLVGRLIADAPPGVPWKWNETSLEVELVSGALASVSDLDVYNGANAGLIETPQGWELFQFQSVELIAPQTWRLSRLLRGQQGSEHVLDQSVTAGARVALFNGAEQRLSTSSQEQYLPLIWRAYSSGADENVVVEGEFTYKAVASRDWAPVHLQSTRSQDGLKLSWIRRGKKGGDGWDAPEPYLEAAEHYRIEIRDNGQSLDVFETNSPELLLENDTLTGLPGTFDVFVAQLGADQTPGVWESISVTV